MELRVRNPDLVRPGERKVITIAEEGLHELVREIPASNRPPSPVQCGRVGHPKWGKRAGAGSGGQGPEAVGKAMGRIGPMNGA